MANASFFILLLSLKHPYKFILLVVLLSVTLNLPRFFRFQLEDNNTDYWPAPIMEDPNYIRFSSYWDEITITGVIPLLALVYFNTSIYLKVSYTN